MTGASRSEEEGVRAEERGRQRTAVHDDASAHDVDVLSATVGEVLTNAGYGVVVGRERVRLRRLRDNAVGRGRRRRRRCGRRSKWRRRRGRWKCGRKGRWRRRRREVVVIARIGRLVDLFQNTTRRSRVRALRHVGETLRVLDFKVHAVATFAFEGADFPLGLRGEGLIVEVNLTVHTRRRWIATPGRPTQVAVAPVVKVDTGVRRVRTEVLDAGDEVVALKLKTISTLHGDHLLRIRVQLRIFVILEDVRNHSGDVEDVYETVTHHLAIALIVLAKEIEGSVVCGLVNVKDELSIREDGVGSEIEGGGVERVTECAGTGNVQTEELWSRRESAPVVVDGVRRRREIGVPLHLREFDGEFAVGFDLGSGRTVLV